MQVFLTISTKLSYFTTFQLLLPTSNRIHIALATISVCKFTDEYT